ncbi:uncharacterized protein VTP21DRAFT_1557 [Calcarisporiella thermophila]|uniref:uncharacterized protein n=1 Tax=Calcarisporiella thermophila TaxID=911321 RepID=UPI0037432A9B
MHLDPTSGIEFPLSCRQARTIRVLHQGHPRSEGKEKRRLERYDIKTKIGRTMVAKMRLIVDCISGKGDVISRVNSDMLMLGSLCRMEVVILGILLQEQAIK